MAAHLTPRPRLLQHRTRPRQRKPEGLRATGSALLSRQAARLEQEGDVLLLDAAATAVAAAAAALGGPRTALSPEWDHECGMM